MCPRFCHNILNINHFFGSKLSSNFNYRVALLKGTAGCDGFHDKIVNFSFEFRNKKFKKKNFFFLTFQYFKGI